MAQSSSRNRRSQAAHAERSAIVHAVVDAYKNDPTPENADRVIKVFDPLIKTYTFFLTTGRHQDDKGKTLPSLRRLLHIVHREWIPAVFCRYTTEDIQQEVTICLLDVALHKPHVVNALPYRVKQMIRELTRDPSVRTTWFGPADVDHRGLDGRPPQDGKPYQDSPFVSGFQLIISHRDDTSALDLLVHLDLTDEERFLIDQVCIRGIEHRVATVSFNKRFGTSLSRRRISEKVQAAKVKVASALQVDLDFTAKTNYAVDTEVESDAESDSECPGREESEPAS